jgi:hypothetical protein
VATVTPDPVGKRNSRKAYRDAHKTHGVVQTALDSAWHWLNGVAGGIANFLGGRIVNALKTVWAAIHTLVDAYKDFVRTYFHLYYWIQIHVLKYLYHLIIAQYVKAIAQLKRDVRRLVRLIYVTTATVLAVALRAVRMERDARVHAVKLAEAKAAREDRMLHQTIEREAASAYQIQRDTRTALIVRLLEFAVTRNPELRDIIGVAIKAVLDLATIDDPVARLALGFVIRDLVDKLGVDKLIGNLVRDLLTPILGEPKPRNLHAVIADMGARLVTAEGFEATFTADGGSEVEQAGRLWRDLTNPAAAAGIVAFTAAAIIDPNGWARTITELVGTPANALITDTANLLRGE